MFGEALERVRGLPKSLLALHMVAKFLFGVGVGILLSHYRGLDGGVVGWLFIVVAVIVAIPSSIRVLSGLGGRGV